MRGVLVLAAVVVAGALAPGTARAATPVQWCGSDRVAADRADAVTNRQIHVIYAVPSDSPDRMGEVAHVIASDLTDTDAWWRREDPTRTPRFDLAAFAGCTTAGGALDISFARLPQPGAFYGPEATRAERLNAALASPVLGFSNRGKKYVVYYDGPMQEPVSICGQATAIFNDGGPQSMAFIYYQAPAGCRDYFGNDFRYSVTATHELVHLLGALPLVGPPHACPGDLGHPCDDPRDILHPEADADLGKVVLDVGRNDYYAHPGSWADIQDSNWLRRLDRPLHRLSLVVTGPGSVTSTLPGILACAGACPTDWEAGAIVTLVPETSAGGVFRGWSGACTGTGACSVTIDAAKSVTATFATPPRPPAVVNHPLQVSVRGGGTVASVPRGVACPRTCVVTFTKSTRVRLTARPARGWRFSGWSGACRGRTACAVTVSSAKRVTATFVRR